MKRSTVGGSGMVGKRERKGEKERERERKRKNEDENTLFFPRYTLIYLSANKRNWLSAHQAACSTVHSVG